MARRWPSHVLHAHVPESLLGIVRPDCTMAIWSRAYPPSVAAEVLRLPVNAYPNVRLITSRPATDVADAFARAAMSADVPVPQALAADVSMLAELYRQVRQVDKVLIRIERITESRGRLLHVDEVQLRLLCTYRGLTTRWLSDDAAVRDGIGKRSNARIYRKPSDIRRLPLGHVALIKGECWPGNAGRGLVHGEPHVSKPHHHRMSVVIDDARYAPEYRK